MTLIPVLEIGVWNAWILIVPFILATVFAQLISKDMLAKFNEGWASERWPRIGRFSARFSHSVIYPLAFIYSIFLPLKIGTVWFYVGLVICIVALAINYIAPINIAKTQIVNEPVTRGVYNFSRHPIYVGVIMFFIGVGIACASWVYILFALVWIIVWLIAIPYEERDLIEKYGDAYRKYMNRTPRWIGLPKS
jgi:protein-S-isoprenylcysteine O-methyltransferase Ste14